MLCVLVLNIDIVFDVVYSMHVLLIVRITSDIENFFSLLYNSSNLGLILDAKFQSFLCKYVGWIMEDL